MRTYYHFNIMCAKSVNSPGQPCRLEARLHILADYCDEPVWACGHLVHDTLKHWECGIQSVAAGLRQKFSKSQKVKTDKF
jgi:hypothetical protein